MFKLVASDVHLNRTAQDKNAAINAIAATLVESGHVKTGYEIGMQEREGQAVTYLGNGIAIPHGTTKTRDLVLKTGISVFHFPEGVSWGEEGELAYVALGIAAKSDEHLAILKQLTAILAADGIEEKIKHVQSEKELIAILTGTETLSNQNLWQSDLIVFDVPADNLIMLQALNSARLKKAGAVSVPFIAAVMSNTPCYLGEGIWLEDSGVGNQADLVAVSKPKSTLFNDEKAVKMLITVASCAESLQPALTALADLIFNQQLRQLLDWSEKELVTFFQMGTVPKPKEMTAGLDLVADSCKEEFILRNIHGLHTRPSSMLIKIIKSYNCKVMVANLSQNIEKIVNATSLMKLVSLGAKKGDRLQFTAIGTNAQEVLDAIGQAIKDGLGEETE